MNKLNIAVSQMTSVDDLEFNVKKMIEDLQSLSAPVDIVFYPENSIYMRLQEGARIPKIELTNPAFDKLSDMAVKKNLALHIGSCPIFDGDNTYNASILISADGSRRISYRKIHLFDISLEGQKPIRESDAFKHGQAPQSFELKGWKLGQTICYDIRFSELFHRYAKESVDIILVPAAFLVPTGKAHWEVLLRARAIESQAFVVASAQAGKHKSLHGEGERMTFGNSLVVDPWGNVIYQGSSDQQEFKVIQLDPELVAKVRRQIPMSAHRRL